MLIDLSETPPLRQPRLRGREDYSFDLSMPKLSTSRHLKSDLWLFLIVLKEQRRAWALCPPDNFYSVFPHPLLLLRNSNSSFIKLTFSQHDMSRFHASFLMILADAN